MSNYCPIFIEKKVAKTGNSSFLVVSAEGRTALTTEQLVGPVKIYKTIIYVNGLSGNQTSTVTLFNFDPHSNSFGTLATYTLTATNYTITDTNTYIVPSTLSSLTIGISPDTVPAYALAAVYYDVL